MIQNCNDVIQLYQEGFMTIHVSMLCCDLLSVFLFFGSDSIIGGDFDLLLRRILNDFEMGNSVRLKRIGVAPSLVFGLGAPFVCNPADDLLLCLTFCFHDFVISCNKLELSLWWQWH